LWRIRVIINILITFFLWQAVFRTNSVIFGYSRIQMLTYIILINVLNGIVLSTQTFRIAFEINSGLLSKFLIQPLNFFAYNLARDLPDKIINTGFSIFEINIMILILQTPIIIQQDLLRLISFVLVSLLAALLYFEINILLSFIGFWSKETWAPRFIFNILLMFLAGTYFPLDIIPKQIYDFLQLLPFTYLVYFPLKIYLGAVDMSQLMKGLGIIIFWLFALMFIIRYVWHTGLKIYTAEGS
jgi:ABC-2 type transport system permease protein